MHQEYTLLVILALLICFVWDYFTTELYKKPLFYGFLVIVVILQTIVDNYLNGRWGLGDYIVGTYDPARYSGVKIWFTPLENYFFGIALVWSNLILYTILHKKRLDKDIKNP